MFNEIVHELYYIIKSLHKTISYFRTHTDSTDKIIKHPTHKHSLLLKSYKIGPSNSILGMWASYFLSCDHILLHNVKVDFHPLGAM